MVSKKRKKMWKNNWDIIYALISFTLGIIITYITLLGCTGGWGCLSVLVIAIIGSGIYSLLMLVAIWRTIRNKKLSRKRWWWILVPVGIGVIGTILGLTTTDFYGLTFIMVMLNPIYMLYFIIKNFLVNPSSTFSIISDQTSQFSVNKFRSILSNFPQLKGAIEGILRV